MCGTPHEWLNTRNSPNLPSGLNQPFESDPNARTVPECTVTAKRLFERLDFVVGVTRSIWVRERR